MENTLPLATILRWTKNSLQICSSQKDRICSVPIFNSIFILGGTNFQASAPTDHDGSRCHNQSVCRKEHNEAFAAGRSMPSRKVVQHASSNSSIVQGIQLMSDLYSTYEWIDTVKKLHEIVYYTALKGQPFSNFKMRWNKCIARNIHVLRKWQSQYKFYFWYCWILFWRKN